MTRLVRDYLEIADLTSLDGLIERLTALRDSLPAGSDAELSIRGDAVFGRQLCVGYLRPLTREEADCEGRYADSGERDLKAAA